MSDRETALAPGSATGRGPLGVDLPLAPSSDPGWLLVEEGFTLVREHEIESIFAIANGYIGTRASLEEGSRLSQPDTFAAGIYVDDPAPELGPALAVLPDWPHLEIAVDGNRLSMESGRMLEHRRMLDLRQGVLWREWRQQDTSGRITRVHFLRLASLADRHVLLQSVAVTAENYSGRIELVAGLAIPNARGERAPLTITRDASTVTILAGETSVAMATGSVPQSKSEAAKSRQEHPSDHLEEHWSWEAGLGETVRLDRVVTVYTSHDVVRPGEHGAELMSRLSWTEGCRHSPGPMSTPGAAGGSIAEVQIVGDDEAQRALRFAAYHLVAAANPAMSMSRSALAASPAKPIVGTSSGTPRSFMLPFYLLTEPAGGACPSDVSLSHARRRPAEGQGAWLSGCPLCLGIRRYR